MPRRPRRDTSGSFHHVMNRAIARRSLFDDADDIRFFLDRLAESAADRGVEIHAFSVLSTHFHFLVRSFDGRLSETFGVAENAHVRRFNRRLHRDGPLVRGRFYSRCVDSLGYMVNVVRYIDFNPVDAGLVLLPAEYPFGSARAYALGGGPDWLRRDVIERIAAMGGVVYLPDDYVRRFGGPLSVESRFAIEQGLIRGNRRLEHLGPVAAAAEEVRSHLTRKALLADGQRAGTPIVDAMTLLASIAALKQRLGAWQVKRGPHRPCGWRLLEIGLLRDWCGETQESLARRYSMSRSGARDACRAHRELASIDADYARRVAEVAQALPPAWLASPAAGGCADLEVVALELRQYGRGTVRRR